MFLVRLEQDKAAQQFLSTSYLGEFLTEDQEHIHLKSVCAVHEVMTLDEKRQSSVNTVYFTNSIISEGVLKVKKSNISFHRDVEDDELIMKGYRDSFAAYRQEKAGLSKVNSKIVSPLGAPMRGN